MSRLNKGLTDQIIEEAEEEMEDPELIFNLPINMQNTVSTGSTLLDLAISGKRKKGGGVPGGIIIEIIGMSSSGKTQLMGEICSSIQAQGGKVKLGDPEAKFDPDYALRYGFKITPDILYMPDTPAEVYKEIHDFIPTGNGIIDCIATDSIAALVAGVETPTEEDTKKKKKQVEDPLIADKMGGMKPKEMHALIRKTARKLKKSSIICIFTNQILESMASYGSKKTTPGGNAVRYFASLRIELSQDSKIEEKIGFVREVPSSDGKMTKKRVEHEKIVGVECTATMIKNHIDDPYQTAPLRIIFGYGFDDVGANLQWIKEVLALNTFLAVDKTFQSLLDARKYIVENKKQSLLKDMVMTYWYEIESKFQNKLQMEERVR
jgi:RecA/RadA recombinase